MVTSDPLASIPSLAEWGPVAKLGEITGLKALPPHASEIVFFATFYSAIYLLTPAISRLFYKDYHNLNDKARHGFDTHIVSSVNALVMCGLSLPLYGDKDLNTLDGYTPYAGFVIASCVGYFLWDLFVTVKYFKYNGWGYLFHALAALYVFCEGLRPFMLNVAAPFIWFEASTPFVNINWFGTYVPGLISPTVRMVNGLVLLVVFFVFRIISGPYHGYFFVRDIVFYLPPGIPYSTAVGVLSSYFVLVGLNFVWFQKMLKIAKKTLNKRK